MIHLLFLFFLQIKKLELTTKYLSQCNLKTSVFSLKIHFNKLLPFTAVTGDSVRPIEVAVGSGRLITINLSDLHQSFFTDVANISV